MDRYSFTSEELGQIKDHGLSLEKVQNQLDQFKMPSPYLNLVRPCTPGDGIKLLDRKKMQELAETYKFEAPFRRCLKFIPASGAASRMFKTLLLFLNQDEEIQRESIADKARSGETEAQELLKFMDGIENFAFFKDLKSLMSKKNFNIDTFLHRGQFTDIIRLLLTEDGLGYASLPKGLLKFHDYPDASRTALEEHLVEAASYVTSQSRQSFLHITVSNEHLGKFETLLQRITPSYEKKYHTSFHVDFSFQKTSTDTIAVGPDNKPFLQTDGRLLFRPGGHGALIENLNDLRADIIFVKNIDNVVVDRFKSTIFNWKKILGGSLITIQKKVFSYMEKLSSGPVDNPFFEEVTAFVREELSLAVTADMENSSMETKRAALIEKLNRPIRICGMVKNEGEPGGGPFWVKNKTGELSIQIVEKAQVNPESKEQNAVFASSTHFNPVDLVCGTKDWQGKPFELRQYVDQDAFFISQKSKDGKELKALEHPGLWNGGMARWITIFIEVPAITFNPVKTINDLLRKEHQPG